MKLQTGRTFQITEAAGTEFSHQACSKRKKSGWSHKDKGEVTSVTMLRVPKSQCKGSGIYSKAKSH